MLNALLSSLNAALAPFAPIFDILEVLIAIIDCLKAIQKTFASVPPKPEKLAKCFPRLARALAKLLRIIPFLTIPAMVGAFLDLVITFLSAIRNVLLSIIRKTLRVLRAQTRAAALPSVALGTIADCASGDIDAFMQNMNENNKPLGRLIELINTFMGLAGLDPIPSPNQIGADATKALSPLDTTVKALKIARLAFP
jgi:hypothetical protein